MLGSRSALKDNISQSIRAGCQLETTERLSSAALGRVSPKFGSKRLREPMDVARSHKA